MAEIVFTLCALTSLACGAMLARGYRRTGVRLLLLAAFAFFGFALNNAILWVDLLVLPTTVDLSLWRVVPALVGVVILLHGLIGEVR